MTAKPQLDVIYVKMPISIDRKHELNQQGFRAIDIRFMPEGYENPTVGAQEEVGETEAEKKARRAAERAAKKAAKAAQANGADEDVDEGQEGEE